MPHHLLRAVLFLVTALLAAYPTCAAGSENSHTATNPAASIEMGDCMATADLSAKEACFASLPPDAIAECEALHLYRCAPYREMHLAGSAMKDAVDRLTAASRSAYSGYLESDPSYVDDLAANIIEADQAWQAWRDAECAMAPYLDGMSRREADDLAEACRAERTRQRISWIHAHTAQLEARSE